MDIYYLNALDTDNTYRVVESVAGAMNPVVVAAPTPPYAHFAWPAAIKHGETTQLYFAGYRSGKWDQALMASKTNGAFGQPTAILTADASEGGIGPMHVAYFQDGSEPYHLYYTHLHSNKVALATSADGVSFTRKGVVFSAATLQQVFLSSAFKHEGKYYLLLHGTDDRGIGRSYLSSALAPDGPFSSPVEIAAPDGFETTLTATAQQDFGYVPGGISVPIGVPLVTSHAGMPYAVVAKKQVGNLVYFASPFLTTVNGPLVSAFATHFSDVRYMPDGTWRAYATGYRSLPMLAEYTGEFAADHLTGPWTPVAAGALPFSPDFIGGRRSTENPSRLQIVD